MSLSLLPMCYLGTINFLYWLYSTFWGICAFLGLSRPLQRRIDPKRIIQEMEAKEQMDMQMKKSV